MAAVDNRLSETDILRLLNPEHANEARLDVAQRLAGNYGRALLGQDQTLIAEQIFRLLVRDTELNVRTMLAESLKTCSAIPRDIVLTMANDVAEVALPMLQFSEVLNEMDLVDLIGSTTSTDRHIAIAKRTQLSERVAESLLDNSDAAPVAKTLLENSNAQLGDATYAAIMDKHGKKPEVMEALAIRPSLPPSVVEKVITVVSDKLKNELQRKYQLKGTAIEQTTEKTRAQTTLALISANTTQAEVLKLLLQLQTNGRLTPSLIITALVQGHLLFFTTGLALLGGIPRENAEKLLRDRGGLGFRALFNRVGLPSEYFASMRDLLPHVMELHAEEPELCGDVFAEKLSERVKNMAHLIGFIRHAEKN